MIILWQLYCLRNLKHLKKSKDFNLIVIISLVATALIVISGYFLVSIGLATWFEVVYSAVSLGLAMVLLIMVSTKHK